METNTARASNTNNLIPASHGLTIYPAPIEEEPATDYRLSVNGQAVVTHRARVSAHPVNKVWPGCQRPTSQTELVSFASWGMTQPVEVSIISQRPVHDVRVRPTSAGIKPQVEGDAIRFRITKPGQFTVEVNGLHHALHLFANPPEKEIPAATNPNVRYFGPGVHCPGVIRLESHQTVYLAAGAVVYGAILAEKAEHVAILGRGILDGSKIDRLDGLTALLCLYDCTSVRIEGITLRDSAVFTLAAVNCRQVDMRNIKILGAWRYNSDGIDFVNSRHCRVEDCFIRAFDDCIVFKGYEKFGSFIYPLQLFDNKWDGSFTVDGTTSRTFAAWQRSMGTYACEADQPISDIQVRRCVVWNDWGKALEIGIETVVEEIRDILFEDCDLIHVAGVAMDVTTHDRAWCKNIVFRNIRVELDDDMTRSLCLERNQHGYELLPRDRDSLPYLIRLEVGTGYCVVDPGRGSIEGVRFQNIAVTSRWMPRSQIHGYDASHLVQRVEIENLRLNGNMVTDLAAGNFERNEFVKDIVVQ